MRTKKITHPIYHKPKELSDRHAHCSFCGGISRVIKAERVTNPITGISYWVPISHTLCKQSILSLSLFQEKVMSHDQD
jgi:hypothetical protein